MENISVGMFSLKMSTISIFVQKNFKQNCIPKFDIFHKKIQWLSYFEKKIVDFKSQQISLINLNKMAVQKMLFVKNFQDLII